MLQSVDTQAYSSVRKSIFISIVICLFSLILSGCTAIGVVVGAGAAAGSMALEERGFEQGTIDRAMGLEINKLLADKNNDLFLNVSITVVEGRVLLTGAVNDQESRISVLQTAWKVDGVDEVINEIQITQDGGILNLSRDTLVKGELVAAITFDKNVHAVNYYTSVVNGTVYLFGIAQDSKEVERVIDHAKQLSYVRRVISQMRLKDDPDRLAWLEKHYPDTSN